MEEKSMKNIIVLKNLPSNIVEEAIVIVKPNFKIKENIIADICKKNLTVNSNEKNYIVKEAENLVNNYVHRIEKKKIDSKYCISEKKYKRLKKLTILFGIVSVLVILANIF